MVPTETFVLSPCHTEDRQLACHVESLLCSYKNKYKSKERFS